jgi:uncharacterized protein
MKTLGLASLTAITFAFASLAGCAVEQDPTSDVATSEVGGTPHFELWQDTSSQFHFHLRAGNHAVLITSEAYTNRTGALNGLLSVLDNGGLVSHYQILTAKNGQPYFNLLAANKQVIATSETYATKQAAQKGVNSTIAAVGAYLEHWDTATGARFEVFQGKDSRYYFKLHAKNGAIVLQSQGYSGEAAALNGTFSVADNGVDAGAYVIQPSASGGYYFNLKASNGQVIATSETYSSKYDAERGRDAIVALLPQIELL